MRTCFRASPRNQSSSRSSNSGYSMTELVLVIIMIGILAVVVVPSFSDTAAFRARGFSDDVQSAARYAQKLAVASGCPVQLQIASGGYALMRKTTCPSAEATFPVAVAHPSRIDPDTGLSHYAGSAPDGTTLSGASMVFYADGSSDGGSIATGGRTFTVIASTGYVQEN